MTHDQDDDRARALGVEPDDLDGHTLEELSDYLEAGRTPADPSIDGSAGCQIALDALQRLQGLSGALIESDAAEMGVDDSWVQRVLSGIASDARAGRRIPFVEAPAGVDFGITEGAVRGLIRSAENAVPGVLVGRSLLDGDVESPGSPVRLAIEVSALYGASIPAAVAALRQEIADRVRRHTDLVLTGIDITVRDVQRVDVWTGEWR